ncbi:hypothetical protein JAAARDRAFT_153575 [Jaapia argillacea MUCL 33604]|uniref:CSC1/OSCA1-like 7TM region domain-containing protein n=1 Tax=Jaapia argillacea MUCL 33604 TaxID=933084 RepID=A0A067QAI2_9AGAM|nr:hypothetical protein JAAARDRAFT_153575 [Jaapia argillacea MUCL 33604]
MSAVSSSSANKSTSQTFITALVTNAGLLLIEVGAFTILKQRLGRIYTPRTYLPPPEKRSNELPKGPWRWIPATLFTPSRDIIHKNGLDAYMFLRYLRLVLIIFTVFWILTWASLLAVDYVGITGTSNDGLTRFEWGNVASQPNRYAAHIGVAWILTFFVLFMIRREMLHFVHMRHQFLISKGHSRLAQARTVLITTLPDELANEHDLRLFASFVPGGIHRVWIYRDSKSLNKSFEKRQKACLKLESAESALLRKATKAWNTREKSHRKQVKKGRKVKDVEKVQDLSLFSENLPTPTPSREFLDDLVPATERPRHRLGFLGLFGKKVDTIDWCKIEIAKLNKEIDEGRNELSESKSLGSAFIECNLQLGAHVLAQCVSYHEPLAMSDKYIEVAPKDMIWSNLDDGAYAMRTRFVISIILTVALLIGWAFPVAFIGSLSNLQGLCSKLPWLEWVCKAPLPVPGIIQGVIPPVLLALLMIVLPIILRLLAWYECIPRYSLVSLSVYKRYYAFLVIHGFLIVTLSSAITSTIAAIINTPTQAVEQLSSRLPDASIFFLTYMATQGLAGAASALIQLGPLVIHFVKKWFLGRTPRQAYSVTFMMPSVDFGTVLPRMSLLATIGIVYSVLAPLINGLAVLAFALLYLSWKFLLTQVFDQPDEVETGGLYFPLAISNLFVALYIEHIALACLFFLNIPVAPKISIAGGVCMIALLVITVLFHLLIYNAFSPISEYLPMSLATKWMVDRYREVNKVNSGTVGQVNKDEDFDLFSRDRISTVLRQRIPILPEIEDRLAQAGKVAQRSSGDHRPSDEHPLNGGVTEPTRSSSPQPSVGGNPSAHSTAISVSESNKSDEVQQTTREVPEMRPTAPGLYNAADLDDQLDEHAFDHPSTYVDQPWIWLPKDTLGLSELLVGELKENGVQSSDMGALMDQRATVEVSRNPPDEQWWGGQNE